MAAFMVRLRSISVRIIAIALTGMLGIGAIAGTAAYLGSQTSLALKIKNDASQLQNKAAELDRLYASARQDIADFLRTQQVRPAETFAQRMHAVASEALSLAGRPEAQGVREPLTKLGELAQGSEAAIAALSKALVETGVDLDSGLLGTSAKAGEDLERLALTGAQNLGESAAWRIAYAAAAIRQADRLYLARREEHLLGDMEVAISRFERYVAAFTLDDDLKGQLTAGLAAYRTAFDAWREADKALVRGIEKLNDALIVASPLIDEIRHATNGDEAAAAGGLEASQDLLMRFIGFIGIGALLASLTVAFAVGRSITGPLARLRRSMKELAEGRTDEPVPETGRSDEIGTMAQMVEVFRANAVERQRLAAAQDADREAQSRRARTVDGLIASFQDGMEGTIRSVAKAVEDLNAVSTALNQAAGSTMRQQGEASGAVDEAAANVGMVSAGATQLRASIQEIAARAAESSRVAQEALATTQSTLDTMRGLETSAVAIGEVVNLIRAIASQTNLLALNATIEAARAGEAGRGFSVVAGEVKALAAQTAQATDEIAAQVAAIQSSAEQAGRALGSVNTVMGTLSSLAGVVAAAVEQQSAAVNSIGANVALAAEKTRAGTEAMGGVADATRRTEAVAAEVEALSRRLNEEAAEVENRVAAFIDGVRTAA
ncbi:MAG TPA: HAMP domain-containing methyl-accepting chemotaxis protein [Microvirga sp.]|jgi:methyl-accepting chemotaxis protein|nr:HAMP domain-containing methyl-accepting chemotaxis protein [Microvirga sp.]